MAKKRTALDIFLDAYLALEPSERPFALVAIQAADRALKNKQASASEAAVAAELGAAAAEEGQE